MGAKSTRKRWTYAEFARLPPSGSTRYEIIDDELVVSPSPGLRHQRIVTHLIHRLFGFVHSNDIGEVLSGPFDVLFAEGDYLVPDIVFVRKDRAELLTDRGAEGAPDLLVEVISPSTGARDRGIKLERYRLYGVAEYWIVDPEAPSVEVWALTEQATEPIVLEPDDTLSWQPQPGGPALDIPLTELFEGA